MLNSEYIYLNVLHLLNIHLLNIHCVLGDQGYAMADYLVTPLQEPATVQERRFNAAHKKTRKKVGCCIGLLKGERFLWSQAALTCVYNSIALYFLQ